MAVLVQCSSCNATHRLYPEDFRNTGTAWHRIDEWDCPACGARNTTQLLSDDQSRAWIGFLSGSAGYGSTAPPQERAAKSDIREYWIQRYLAEHPEAVGLERIQGPFDSGPDFIGYTIDGRRVEIEVERDAWNYLEHKHHLDARWANVEWLVVLNPSVPPPEIAEKLPREIKYLDIVAFSEWFKDAGREYALGKTLERKLAVVGEEFHRRWLDVCPDRDRDMAACPECESCAYFGDGAGNPTWKGLAFSFLRRHGYPIDPDLDVTQIPAEQLDAFFRGEMGAPVPVLRFSRRYHVRRH